MSRVRQAAGSTLSERSGVVAWRAPVLVDEARRNLAAAPLRSGVLVVLVLAVVAGGTAADVGAAVAGRREVTRRAADGAWVTVARAGDGIDATACRRLGSQPGVLAAGGIATPSSSGVVGAPDTLFEVYDTTPELVGVLGAALPNAADTVAVGSAVARELGLVAGSHLGLPGRGTFAVDVLPDTARSARFSRAVLVPDDPATVAECWVSWRPGAPDVRARTEALLPVDTPVTVSAVLAAGAFAEDPDARYGARWSRWWCLGAGALLAAVWLLGLRARRRELALYLAVGTGRAELAVLTAVEALAVTTVGAVGGWAWGLAVAGRGGELLRRDLVGSAVAALAVPAVVVLATVLAGVLRRPDVAAELKGA